MGDTRRLVIVRKEYRQDAQVDTIHFTPLSCLLVHVLVLAILFFQRLNPLTPTVATWTQL